MEGGGTNGKSHLFFLTSLGCFYWYFNAVRSKDLCF